MQASQSDSSSNTGLSAAVTFTVDTTAPSIAITSPAAGDYTAGPTPTISGTAGVLSGDSSMVTVNIYAGTAATGSPVQTLTTSVNPVNGAFSVIPATLFQGQYTLQASQGDSAGNTGLSVAVTVIVPIPGGRQPR